MPVARSTSMIAQVQKAWSSSQIRSWRLPSASWAQILMPGLRAAGRVKACPPAVNVPPGGVRPGGRQCLGGPGVVPGGGAGQDRQDGQPLAGAASIRDLRRRVLLAGC